MLTTRFTRNRAQHHSRTLPAHPPLIAALLATIGLIGWLSLLTPGCAAAPPRAELDHYREAFAAAQQVAEQVLIEAEIIWKQAEGAAHATEAPSASKDWLAFNAAKTKEADSLAEQIELRWHFWRIARRYNDALLALAEGRSPDDAGRTATRFADALRDVPIDRLASAADQMLALRGVLGESLSLIDNQITRRRFEQALRAGSPIVNRMLELLRDDAADLYDIHLVRYHQQRRAIDESLQLNLLPSFRSLYEATGADEDKTALFNAVRAVLAEDMRYREEELPAFGDRHDDASPYAPQDHAQLVLLRDAIEQLGRKRRALDTSMQQAKHLLESYHALLTTAQHQLNTLQQSVEGEGPIPAEQVLRASLAVYRELVNYRRESKP